MERTLKIIEINDSVILKDGRKKYAQISFNKNPEYNWIIYFRGGLALSGYKTKELAIERANRMFNDFHNMINSIAK
jgi:hypothetical protein